MESFHTFVVAPFTGAWIEIRSLQGKIRKKLVAPFTGAWIEIVYWVEGSNDQEVSHPSRVRGLKFDSDGFFFVDCLCRTLHGCVD